MNIQFSCGFCLLGLGYDAIYRFAFAAQHDVIGTLNRISANRSIVFSQSNSDVEFHVCMAHMLFILTLADPEEEK